MAVGNYGATRVTLRPDHHPYLQAHDTLRTDFHTTTSALRESVESAGQRTEELHSNISSQLSQSIADTKVDYMTRFMGQEERLSTMLHDTYAEIRQKQAEYGLPPQPTTPPLRRPAA